jgi:hypothetical protein
MRNDRKDARLDPRRSCFRSIGNLYEVQRGNYEVIPVQRRDAPGGSWCIGTHETSQYARSLVPERFEPRDRASCASAVGSRHLQGHWPGRAPTHEG